MKMHTHDLYLQDYDDDNEQEIQKSSQVFQAIIHLNDLIYEYDPSMEYNLKMRFSKSITNGMKSTKKCSSSSADNADRY